MATVTAEASAVASGDWTLDAGSDDVTAVNYGGSHDDDTSKIQSLNVIGSYQEYDCSVGGLANGDTVTQVDVVARCKRALATDANFTIGYSFTKSPSGTQSGTSAAQTSTSAWTTFTYTDSGLSVLYGSQFRLKITTTQARYVECSTLYAVITYTPAGSSGLTKQAMFYAQMTRTA